MITVNYNTPEVTAALLDSLARLEYPNWEIIVVDNASPEHSSAYLAERYPFIRHISTPSNLGFAGGNNVGLQIARGEYVFFINNDTEVTPQLVTVLVAHLQAHPECGLVCPKIKYHHTPDTIQYAGAIGLHPLTSRSFDLGYLEKDQGQHDVVRPTDLPNGAAMMAPMALIQQVGPMSELFFLYYEELDWAARIKRAGYAIHYVGLAEIYHKESVSTGRNSPFKTYYLYRNRLLYVRRNYQGWRLLVAASFFILVSTTVHAAKHSWRREYAHAQAIWRALRWNLTHRAFQEPTQHSSTLQGQLLTP